LITLTASRCLKTPETLTGIETEQAKKLIRIQKCLKTPETLTGIET
jgi:ribosomal protein L34E